MENKINTKAIVYEGRTSKFIFFFPTLISLVMLFYSINNININHILIYIPISIICFFIAFINFHKKTIFITKKSIYCYVMGKQTLKWSLQDDFYSVDIKQDNFGKFLGYGTLTLFNKNKMMYEYFFLSDPKKFKDNLMVTYEKLMKKLDPNFIPSYMLDNNDKEEKIDSLEDLNEK